MHISYVRLVYLFEQVHIKHINYIHTAYTGHTKYYNCLSQYHSKRATTTTTKNTWAKKTFRSFLSTTNLLLFTQCDCCCDFFLHLLGFSSSLLFFPRHRTRFNLKFETYFPVDVFSTLRMEDSFFWRTYFNFFVSRCYFAVTLFIISCLPFAFIFGILKHYYDKFHPPQRTV